MCVCVCVRERERERGRERYVVIHTCFPTSPCDNEYVNV